MKFPFAKLRDSDEALESALRQSTPRTDFPPNLHRFIMRAVHASRGEPSQLSLFATFQRFAIARVLPVSGLAALVILGTWLALHQRTPSKVSSSQSLPELSTAFDTSREFVNTLPSAAVGPLSDELDKVNQDLDHTAEFLLATLP